MILTTYRAESGRFKNSPEIHVRHILIAGQDEAARSKAEKILADLHAGTDFEQLARQHSEDPGTAPKGGDLGFFPKGKMVPAFEQAAFGLVTQLRQANISAEIYPDNTKMDKQMKYANAKRCFNFSYKY